MTRTSGGCDREPAANCGDGRQPGVDGVDGVDRVDLTRSRTRVARALWGAWLVLAGVLVASGARGEDVVFSVVLAGIVAASSGAALARRLRPQRPNGTAWFWGPVVVWGLGTQATGRLLVDAGPVAWGLAVLVVALGLSKACLDRLARRRSDDEWQTTLASSGTEIATLVVNRPVGDLTDTFPLIPVDLLVDDHRRATVEGGTELRLDVPAGTRRLRLRGKGEQSSWTGHELVLDLVPGETARLRARARASIVGGDSVTLDDVLELRRVDRPE